MSSNVQILNIVEFDNSSTIESSKTNFIIGISIAVFAKNGMYLFPTVVYLYLTHKN
jgi:hypothetical protein